MSEPKLRKITVEILDDENLVRTKIDIGTTTYLELLDANTWSRMLVHEINMEIQRREAKAKGGAS